MLAIILALASCRLFAAVTSQITLTQWSPTFLAPGTSFMEDSFSTDRGWWWLGFRMSQVHNIYGALYYYYISSTLDHQVLDPGGWGDPYCKESGGCMISQGAFYLLKKVS